MDKPQYFELLETSRYHNIHKQLCCLTSSITQSTLHFHTSNIFHCKEYDFVTINDLLAMYGRGGLLTTAKYTLKNIHYTQLLFNTYQMSTFIL